MQSKSKNMEKHLKINNVFTAKFVAKLLFGNGPIIKNAMNGIGLNFGLKKVSPFVRSFKSLVTAAQSWIGFAIIGFLEFLTNLLITRSTDISFMTARIFTRTDAL